MDGVYVKVDLGREKAAMPVVLAESADNKRCGVALWRPALRTDAGRPCQRSLFPRLNLAGMDLILGGHLGNHLLPPHRLKGYPGLERL